MRHRVKKIKLKGGKDANKMLMVKLAGNFFDKGELTTTVKKAKLVKAYIEQLVEKSKVKTEANKNCLLHYLHNKKIVNFLFETVGPAFKNVNGGYVRIIKIGQRDSDGAAMAKLEWSQFLTKKP